MSLLLAGSVTYNLQKEISTAQTDANVNLKKLSIDIVDGFKREREHRQLTLPPNLQTCKSLPRGFVRDIDLALSFTLTIVVWAYLADPLPESEQQKYDKLVAQWDTWYNDSTHCMSIYYQIDSLAPTPDLDDSGQLLTWLHDLLTKMYVPSNCRNIIPAMVAIVFKYKSKALTNDSAAVAYELLREVLQIGTYTVDTIQKSFFSDRKQNSV